jgi:hypothetical protein
MTAEKLPDRRDRLGEADPLAGVGDELQERIGVDRPKLSILVR